MTGPATTKLLIPSVILVLGTDMWMRKTHGEPADPVLNEKGPLN